LNHDHEINGKSTLKRSYIFLLHHSEREEVGAFKKGCLKVGSRYLRFLFGGISMERERRF
jgi:hypothetical protein